MTDTTTNPPQNQGGWMSPKAPFWWPDARGFMMIAVVAMAAVSLFYRLTHPAESNDKLLDMMVTITFGTALVTIVQFLFGSSRNSSDKDETIQKITTTAATQAATLGKVEQ